MVHKRSGSSRRISQKAQQQHNEQRAFVHEKSKHQAIATAYYRDEQLNTPPTELTCASAAKDTVGRGPGRGKIQGLLPQSQEVIAAVASLYCDQLKPFGRILRKRVAERAQAAGVVAPEGCNVGSDVLPDVDVHHIRSICENSNQLQVELEEGGDWSVSLLGCSPNFVNVYSPCDIYPEEMWAEATAYFENLGNTDMLLPGGRVSCAKSLVSRDIPFLKGYSLGQVCHIVQLAISQKKILGYLKGAMVPYGSSLSMMKDKCAVSQCATVGPESSSTNFATWESARSCLKVMLENAANDQPKGGPGKLPLSNVKRLFRSGFQLELSETKLGHSKLSELMQDPGFADLCSIHLEGNGYTVVQKRDTSALPDAQTNTSSAMIGMAPGLEMSQTAEITKTPFNFEAFADSAAFGYPYTSQSLENSMSPTNGASSPGRHTDMFQGMSPLQHMNDVATMSSQTSLNYIFEGCPGMPELPVHNCLASMHAASFDPTLNPFDHILNPFNLILPSVFWFGFPMFFWFSLNFVNGALQYC